MDWPAWIGAVAAVLGVIFVVVKWLSAPRRTLASKIDSLDVTLREHMTAEAQTTNDLKVALSDIAGNFKVNAAEHAALDARVRRLEDRR